MTKTSSPIRTLFVALLIAQMQFLCPCTIFGMSSGHGDKYASTTDVGCSSCKSNEGERNEQSSPAPSDHDCCHQDLMPVVVNEGLPYLDRDDSWQLPIQVDQSVLDQPVDSRSITVNENRSIHGPPHFTLLDLHCQLRV